MIIIETMSENAFSINLSTVVGIDLVVFMILIGLLIFREILSLYTAHHSLKQPDAKLNMVSFIDIVFIPFFYIFIYVLLFRLLNPLY